MSSAETPFRYDLPREKIADRPLRPYDNAKLLLINKDSKNITSSQFKDLPDFLSNSDVLVFNDTKVNKARLFGKIAGGNKEAEFLVLKKLDGNIYHCLARPIKNLKPESIVNIDEKLSVKIIERISDQVLEVEFISKDGNAESLMEQLSVMPIPPYIREGHADENDIKDYQSLFAKNAGSIAAPTASLHFTEGLLQNIKNKNVALEFLTLHIGMSSVRPLWDGDESDKMRSPGQEFYIYSSKLKEDLIEYKKQGKRIIAVGTTVVRALESLAGMEYKNSNDGELIATELFITPGYKFKLADALITNFHFPASTHLLLVQAMLGEALLKESYDFALQNNFRFLSYGDGMFIQ